MSSNVFISSASSLREEGADVFAGARGAGSRGAGSREAGARGTYPRGADVHALN